MSYVIAIAGKGGTGKTTIAALLVRLLKEKGKGAVLAVDADPNNNLGEALGLEVSQTIGSIIDEVSRNLDKIPSGMSKDRFIEYRVQTSLIEGEGFDLLSMGRPEGPGCYCYVNNILRSVVERLIKDYSYIVIDNEAGLEHLSRRTTRACDALLVVSDPTPVGLKAASRIAALVRELEIKAARALLVVNCTDAREWKGRANGPGLEYLGSIPRDPQIAQISLRGNSLLQLDNRSESIAALLNLGEKIWQKN